MSGFIEMRGPADAESILNYMGNKIFDFKHQLACQSAYSCNPNLVAYVGHDQWAALKTIEQHGMQCTDSTPYGDIMWLGVRFIRVMKNHYFFLTEVNGVY